MMPLDVIVVTGFLGSGKTTLLRDLLASANGSGTAVIVNEAGEIDLDGAILQEVAGIPVATLANGCVCCQATSDLAATISALLDSGRDLRRIVIETSGLSRPGPVLRQLSELAGLPMRIAVVATYDAERGLDVATFDEAAAQWAAAHAIVLTKADLVDSDRLAQARNEIAGLNPLADVIVTSDRMEAVARAFEPRAGQAAMPDPEMSKAPPHPRIGVFLARPQMEMTFDALNEWLDNLAGRLGERLLRVKGMVRIADHDRPLVIQSVGTLFAAPRPIRSDDPRSFLVIIARDADVGELADVGAAMLIAPWSRPGPFAPPLKQTLRADAV